MGGCEVADLRDFAACDVESWHKKVYVQRAKELLFHRTRIEYPLTPIAEKASMTFDKKGLRVDPPTGVVCDLFLAPPLLPDAASTDVSDKRIPHPFRHPRTRRCFRCAASCA